MWQRSEGVGSLASRWVALRLVLLSQLFWFYWIGNSSQLPFLLYLAYCSFWLSDFCRSLVHLTNCLGGFLLGVSIV